MQGKELEKSCSCQSCIQPLSLQRMTKGLSALGKSSRFFEDVVMVYSQVPCHSFEALTSSAPASRARASAPPARMGFKVAGFGLGFGWRIQVYDLGLSASFWNMGSGFGLRARCLGLGTVSGLGVGFGVQNLGFGLTVQGLGFGVVVWAKKV